MTAITTFRIELLKYYDVLHPDPVLFQDRAGWKCLYAKNYINSITKGDIQWFIQNTFKRLKLGTYLKNANLIQFIVDRVNRVYNCPINELGIAIALTSKTEINRDDEIKSVNTVHHDSGDIEIMESVITEPTDVICEDKDGGVSDESISKDTAHISDDNTSKPSFSSKVKTAYNNFISKLIIG